MYSGLGQLPEKLIRKAHDDIYACIRCKSNDIEHSLQPNPASSNPNRREPRMCICNNCGARLEYLEDRTYGLTNTQIETNFRNNETDAQPWGRRPLWMIPNDG